MDEGTSLRFELLCCKEQLCLQKDLLQNTRIRLESLTLQGPEVLGRIWTVNSCVHGKERDKGQDGNLKQLPIHLLITRV